MTCDAAQALYERTDGAAGCWLHVQVHVADDWQTVGLFAAVAVLLLLGALLASQMRGG